jgi:hypothetical protein
MKRFQLFVILFLSAISVGLIYDTVNIEYRVFKWEEHLQTAEAINDINTKILDAHIYSKDVLNMAQLLVEENSALLEREAKTVQYVTQLEEENLKLKNSLKEAVVTIGDQITQLNDLHEELEKCYFKIDLMEKALELLTPVEDPEAIKQDIIDDIFGVIEGVNTATTVLNILL